MRHLKKLTIFRRIRDAVESSDIAAILRRNRHLEELHFGNISNGDMVVEGIAQALRFRSLLKNLQLYNNNLTIIGVMAIGRILQQCLSLTILTISDNQLELDIDSAAALAEGIKMSLSLKELSISVTSIPMAAGCRILDALSQKRIVTKVELKGIELGHDGSLSVARLIEGDGAIESLSLDHKGGGALGGEASRTIVYLTPIFRSLASNCTLKSMKLCNMCVRTDGIQSMSNTSLCNSSLEKLELSFCRFEVDEEYALFVHVFFTMVAALKSLSLSWCGSGDEVFVPLLDALQSLSRLEGLCLSFTDIGDRGAFALASLLSDSQTLQSLYLHYSTRRITGEGNRALLDSVKLNYSLTELGGLELTNSQKYELQFYLDRNNGPARLVEATIPLALWPHALSQAACYRNKWDESSDEGESDDSASESNDESHHDDDRDDEEGEGGGEEEAEDLRREGPDMLYFLVRESALKSFETCLLILEAEGEASAEGADIMVDELEGMAVEREDLKQPRRHSLVV